MSSQSNATPKSAARATSKTTTKAATPTRKTGAMIGKSTKTGAARVKRPRDMTLEELSLRAYKMTYKQLHGSKKKKK